MTIKTKMKKVGKLAHKQKGKKKTASLRKDTKKTKKIENLNIDGTDVAEIVRLSATGVVRRTANTLENKSLQSDWKKDKRIREKSKAEKQAIADKLEKQIESISGFSL
ncbi:hypothetical protein HG537_0B00260 [Torulaspora globosa]|uniref:Uncharacterized protein n=1 Tax=Torulaspora globosa TaxID=48254 RepID=A0A7H9HN29_9SACH|nr:hypothetical protein HG537_0B00260 [Torulaspora sp. CBS 2947]